MKGHETDSIAMIGGALRRDLKVKLKVIADKVTEGRNKEKKVWRNLHEAECGVSEMKTVIDEVVDDAVSGYVTQFTTLVFCCHYIPRGLTRKSQFSVLMKYLAP